MNHSFVTTKKWITTEKLFNTLVDISHHIFNNQLYIEQASNLYFDVINSEESYRAYISRSFIGITIESRHKLHIRPQPGDFNHWVESVFLSEIALVFGGLCGNEGINERWKPNPNEFPKFTNYWKALNPDTHNTKFMKNIFKGLIKNLPPNMRQFV